MIVGIGVYHEPAFWLRVVLSGFDVVAELCSSQGLQPEPMILLENLSCLDLM